MWALARTRAFVTCIRVCKLHCRGVGGDDGTQRPCALVVDLFSFRDTLVQRAARARTVTSLFQLF